MGAVVEQHPREARAHLLLFERRANLRGRHDAFRQPPPRLSVIESRAPDAKYRLTDSYRLPDVSVGLNGLRSLRRAGVVWRQLQGTQQWLPVQATETRTIG